VGWGGWGGTNGEAHATGGGGRQGKKGTEEHQMGLLRGRKGKDKSEKDKDLTTFPEKLKELGLGGGPLKRRITNGEEER